MTTGRINQIAIVRPKRGAEACPRRGLPWLWFGIERPRGPAAAPRRRKHRQGPTSTEALASGFPSGRPVPPAARGGVGRAVTPAERSASPPSSSRKTSRAAAFSSCFAQKDRWNHPKPPQSSAFCDPTRGREADSQNNPFARLSATTGKARHHSRRPLH